MSLSIEAKINTTQTRFSNDIAKYVLLSVSLQLPISVLLIRNTRNFVSVYIWMSRFEVLISDVSILEIIVKLAWLEVAYFKISFFSRFWSVIYRPDRLCQKQFLILCLLVNILHMKVTKMKENLACL